MDILTIQVCLNPRGNLLASYAEGTGVLGKTLSEVFLVHQGAMELPTKELSV